MPITKANGIDLYYEVHGEGEPLLLIMWFLNFYKNNRAKKCPIITTGHFYFY
jgi:hypothetical protein